MGRRISTAKWSDKHSRWQVNVQRDGVRRSFYSLKPGRQGQRECNGKADRWLDENLVSGHTKVDMLYGVWLEDVKQVHSTGYHCNLESLGRNWILPELGGKRIENITEIDLQRVINRAYAAKKSKQTLRGLRAVLMTFLKYARQSRASNLRPETLKVPDDAPVKNKKILQPKDISLLFGEQKFDHWFVNAYRFYVASGLRRGELIAIQPDRDIIGNTLSLKESVNRFREITEGKNKNAQRTFVLDGILQGIIRDQKELLKKNNIKTQYLFVNTFGARIHPATLYSNWGKYCARLGIQKTSLHELRHTFISLCKEVPLELLKGQVGHSLTMDTFRQYGHEVDGEKEQTAHIINKELSKYIK